MSAIVQFVAAPHIIQATLLLDANQLVCFIKFPHLYNSYILYFKKFPTVEIPQQTPVDPCQPSPCGPNSQCQISGDSPSCSCLQSFIGNPPNCRAECVSNSDCISSLACINQKCRDPCPGLCGENADCRVVNHSPNCVCLSGYIGDPFTNCYIRQEIPQEQSTPCIPSPCGFNAICREQNNAGACTCQENYIGNPYEGCRPECVLNSDCPSNKACINTKCQDPCPGACGQNADCQVVNHLPSCTCFPGYIGDPFRYCNIKPVQRKLYSNFEVLTLYLTLKLTKKTSIFHIEMIYSYYLHL